MTIVPGSGATGDRIEPQLGAHLVARLDAGTDASLGDRRLGLKIGRRPVGPGELQIIAAEDLADDPVDQRLQPDPQRLKPLSRRGILGRFRRCSVGALGERRRRHRDGEAHDPGEPFIELVLQRHVADRLILEAARHEARVAPGREIALQERGPVLMELADLQY